ncbi:hypothetical protein MMC17_009608 [Xylographa soralifera]|nr:hypothetical protein [Xylographa soralifera]
MAVFKGIWASVVVDGQSLVEYDEDVNEIYGIFRDSNIIVKYVEAISAARFEVRFGWDVLDLKGCEGLMFQVDLDGKYMDAAVCSFKNKTSSGHLHSARRCVDGQWTQEQFRFAEIISVDGQSGSMDSSEASDLASIGKIVLCVCRVKNIRQSTTVTTTANVRTGPAISGTIPEKALKGRALSHKTSLDPPEKIAALRSLHSDYIDKVDSPFVKFEFRYRSRRALQIEGIIPRSPSPIPLEDRPVESLTREEAIELLARRTARNKSDVKSEGSTALGVKREHDPEFDEILASSFAPKKARASQDIEVIDLLDD